MILMADEEYGQACAEFEGTPLFDSDELGEEDNADQEFEDEDEEEGGVD
jgi:hypothetical protein